MEKTIGLNDFAVIDEDTRTTLEENITQERAFYLISNNDGCILQTWSYNEAEDVMCWNDVK